MNIDYNLNRELGVERDRWDCPEYHAIIFTSEEKWESVIDYVGIWDDASYDDQRQRLHLMSGGIIRFYNLKDKTNEGMKRDIAGLEITTSVIDTSVIQELNCDMKGFPLYVMSRMRSICKYTPRLVII